MIRNLTNTYPRCWIRSRDVWLVWQWAEYRRRRWRWVVMLLKRIVMPGEHEE